MLESLEEANFHPATNQSKRQTRLKPEDSLLQFGQIAKQKREQLKQELKRQAEAENTFKP